MSGRPEDDVLGELRVGGEAALAEWFGRERPRLERVVRFRLDPRLSARADPEDVLQEAYLDAAKRLASYLNRPEAPFFVWLRGIVLNTLMDLHRRHLGAQRRDAGREIPFLSDGANSSESDSPAAWLAARVDGIIGNWLIPAPDANPGMLEMMRLRDRQPPYENPVPWAGEFVGKYLTSCALICRLSDDPALREVTARVMCELIRTQAADGYLGPFPDNHLLARWDLWGHYHCLLAMILWHQDTGDPDALQAACRAADLMCATFLDSGKRVHDAGSHEMNMAVIHALGLLYRQTRKDAYLRLMREIEQDWQKPPAGDYHRMALRGIEFYQTPKPRWESLHPMIGRATVPASYQPGPKNVGLGCNPNYTGPEVFQGALADVQFLREALPAEAVQRLAGGY